MPGPLLAAGIQAAGGILGGMSRNRAAKKLKKSIDTTMLRAREEIVQDQQRAMDYRNADQNDAILYRMSDEARLLAATGFDFKKLRDDAQKAGFNPLTVLQATGGAGYDGRGAVLTTPFISRPFMGYSDVTQMHAQLQAGVGGALVDTAGYFGDAIAAAGSAFFDQKNRETDFDLERRRLSGMEAETMLRYGSMMRGAYSGQSSSPFGAPIGAIDPRPPAKEGFMTGLLKGTVTDIMFGGKRINADQGTSDSEEIEKRYGDFVQALYGVGVLGMDFWKSGWLQERAANQVQRETASTAWEKFETTWDGLIAKRSDAIDWLKNNTLVNTIKSGGYSQSREPLRISIPVGWGDR